MASIKVKGMSCMHCVKSVTEALGQVPGVVNVRVDLASGMASFDEAGPIDMAAVRRAILAIGFEVEG